MGTFLGLAFFVGIFAAVYVLVCKRQGGKPSDGYDDGTPYASGDSWSDSHDGGDCGH
jgi:hypothetical protein